MLKSLMVAKRQYIQYNISDKITSRKEKANQTVACLRRNQIKIRFLQQTVAEGPSVAAGLRAPPQ